MNQIKRKFVRAHMDVAGVYAKLSYCTRLKVGSVIVKNDSIIAFGYNGMPSGEPNVCELEDGTTDPRVRHSEINALRKLIRSSETSIGAIMFVTHAPCPICAIEIAESGIAAVFFENTYKNLDGVKHLLRSGVKVFQVVPNSDEIYEYCSFNMTPHLYVDEPIRF